VWYSGTLVWYIGLEEFMEEFSSCVRLLLLLLVTSLRTLKISQLCAPSAECPRSSALEACMALWSHSGRISDRPMWHQQC